MVRRSCGILTIAVLTVSRVSVVCANSDLECTGGNTVTALDWSSLDLAVKSLTRGCIDLSGAQTVLLEEPLAISAGQELKIFSNSSSGTVVLDAGHRHCFENYTRRTWTHYSDATADVAIMGKGCARGPYKSHFLISGSLFLERLSLQNGWSGDWNSGSLRFQRGGTLVARNSEFRNNAAIDGGGVMQIWRTGTVSATFEDCVFSHNFAQKGGVVAVTANTGAVALVFRRCTFSNNRAKKMYHEGYGGAIWCVGDTLTTLRFSECLFAHNTAMQFSDDFFFRAGAKKPSIVLYGTQWNHMYSSGIELIQNGSSCSDPSDVSQDCTPCPQDGVCTVGGDGTLSIVYSCLPCSHCSVGTFRNSTTFECSVCPGGRYQPSTSESTACLQCPAGRYQPSTSKASNHDACEACPAGNSSVEGSWCCDGSGIDVSGGCDLCPRGKFSRGARCFVCRAGEYTSYGGRSACTLCAPGTYLEDDSADHWAHGSELLCRPCPVGRASGAPGSGGCEICGAGRFSGGMGNSQCQECAPGSVSDDLDDTSGDATGHFACTECSAGSFANDSGSSTCKPCARGRSQPEPGRTACEACSPGSFQPASGADNCTRCPSGRIPNFDQSGCDALDCPALQKPGDSACEVDTALAVLVAASALVAVVLFCLLYARLLRIRHFRLVHQAMTKMKNRARIEESLASIRTLDFPMAVLRAETFLGLSALIPHETAGSRQLLLYLNTVAEIVEFVSCRKIVFISHQWLSFSEPDPENRHYDCVVDALHRIMDQRGWSMPDVYIWVDYISIPQLCRYTQKGAISSLPIYASHASVFIIVAPKATHINIKSECNLDTYARRTWCRAECLSHFCIRGMEDMLVIGHAGLEHIAEDWLVNNALLIFEGDCTCCRLKHVGLPACDKELLVTPVLALYARVLWDKDHSASSLRVYNIIKTMRSRMFPTTFTAEFALSLEEKQKKSLGGTIIGLQRLWNRSLEDGQGEFAKEERELFGTVLVDLEEEASKKPRHLHKLIRGSSCSASFVAEQAQAAADTNVAPKDAPASLAADVEVASL